MLSSNAKLFAIDRSLDAEMRSFRQIMSADSDRGKLLLTSGQSLVSSAENGSYRKFCELAMQAVREPDFPKVYFLSKSFSAAVLNHHLLIAAFLLSNGYPVNNSSCPNVLLECLKSDMGDEECCEVTEFLGKNNFDFNVQEDKTWATPLHYAVRRALPRTVEQLLQLGADANAVADKDEMPLQIAQSLPTSAEKSTIISSLESRGARVTWKRGVVDVADFPFATCTNISAKPSSLSSQPPGPPSDSATSPPAPPSVPEKPKYVKFSSAVLAACSEEDGALLFSTG